VALGNKAADNRSDHWADETGGDEHIEGNATAYWRCLDIRQVPPVIAIEEEPKRPLKNREIMIV